MNSSAHLTAAVVSWNTRDLLIRCLHSLSTEVERGQADVWVVDNGSTDGSPDAARAQAPWARLLQPRENLGFGRAINLVAENSAADWLLIANADVALTPGALQAMLASAADDRVGCVAPRLVLPDGSTQHSVYPLPTVLFTLAFNLGVHRLSTRLADWLCLEGSWNPDRPRAVPWAIGACLLFRRAAFDAVGGFDEAQWMYAEDLDLEWRLREEGWITRYQPEARVLHESGASTRAAFGEDRASRFMTATYQLLLRRRGCARMLTTGLLNIAGATIRAIWMSPLAAVSGRWRALSEDNRRWLKAHLHALRSVTTPMRSR